MRPQRAITIIASFLIVVTSAFALYSVYLLTAGRDSGSVISDAGISIGGPFTLTDDDGNRVTEADYAGRAHLVFFGFTHCPEICPTTLSEATAVLNELGDDAGKLDVLFISIDPERDTPEALHEYVSNFHPQITGLSGTAEEVASVARSFRAYYKKVPFDDGDYTMDHSTVVYLMDKENNFVGPVALDREPGKVAEQLRAYL
ncbi:MAG: SCO family protein [Tepidamorphaceae bacterium]|nr:SCO family protein [Rhodobiaceae bacterium]MCC0050161.1 SCO family protein [Rhodobiaceae bacterium]